MTLLQEGLFMPNQNNSTTDLIRAWATERKLDTAGSSKQMLKLIEEVGEVASAIAKDNLFGIIDGIGDCYVVLTILAMQYGVPIETCIDSAYKEIKDRKGVLRNGVFIKEEPLTAPNPDCEDCKVK